VSHSDLISVNASVADPDLNQDPDPSDPFDFGPPGSGFIAEVWMRIRIRSLLSPSKNSKKNLDSYCFVTSF
jgi:hypothetical protein